MSHDPGVDLVDQPVPLSEPLATGVVPTDRKVSRVAAVGLCVDQAPEVGSVKPQLHHVGAGLAKKRQIVGMVVAVPVCDQASELESPCGIGRRRFTEHHRDQQQHQSGHNAF